MVLMLCNKNHFPMVLMVHNWFKAILNQLCTISTNKYMYHKWKIGIFFMLSQRKKREKEAKKGREKEEEREREGRGKEGG